MVSRIQIDSVPTPATLGALVPELLLSDPVVIPPHRELKQGEGDPTKPKGHQVYYLKRRARGLCAVGGCPQKAEARHTLCRKHLQMMSRRQKQRYRERAREALCIYCGERPRFWGVRCVICRQRFAKDPLPPAARRALRLFREAETRYETEQLQVEARRVIRKLLASGEIKGSRAQALALYAGIHDGKWRTYANVGQIMNMSKEGVRKLLLPSKMLLLNILSDKVPWKSPRRSGEE